MTRFNGSRKAILVVGMLQLGLWATGCVTDASDPTGGATGRETDPSVGRDLGQAPGAGADGTADLSRPVDTNEITDGTSNTIVVGESADALIAAVTQQLNNRFFEAGSSTLGGSNSQTGTLQLGLCSAGLARVTETTLFAGSTPTDFLDFDSTQTLDGVWSVVLDNAGLAIEIRDQAAGRTPGPLLRRFSIELDASGAVAGIDGRSLLRNEDLTGDCAQAEARERQLAAAITALNNQRIVLTAANVPSAGAIEIVLCESGRYGLRETQARQVTSLEAGAWSIELDASGLLLVLDSDPAFDPSGQTFRTTVAVQIDSQGGVRIGTGNSSLTPIQGNCETAIQDLLN
ncbi:MAG: hypothetical protein HZB38_14660 [Planctomycetes bacterium]|nr:hypothetical protein [Planctomycetota bacterium]